MESKQNPNNLVLEDRYELTEIIGEGGMAVVYKALDRRLNRYVAVKIMRPEMAQQEEFRQRFFVDFAAEEKKGGSALRLFWFALKI